MDFLRKKIKSLRKQIKSVETDVYSASRSIGNDKTLLNTMTGLLLVKVIQGELNFTMHDLEYDARLIIDPTHGSDEF